MGLAWRRSFHLWHLWGLSLLVLVLSGCSLQSSDQETNGALGSTDSQEGYSGAGTSGVQSPLGIRLVARVAPGNEGVEAGVPFQIQIQIEDLSGKVLSDYGGSFDLEVGSVSVLTGIAPVLGVIDFSSVVLTATGSFDVQISSKDLSLKLGQIRVGPGPLDLERSEITLSQSRIPSGTQAYLRWIPRDRFGNVLGLESALPSYSVESLVDGSTGAFGGSPFSGDSGYLTEITGVLTGRMNRIRFAVNGLDVTSSFPLLEFQVTHGEPTSLVWVENPSPVSMTAGSAFALGAVEARDSNGNLCTSGNVTFELDPEFNSSGGSFDGQASGVFVTALSSMGRASLAGARILKSGSGYRIRASVSESVKGTAETDVTVVPGVASGLAWVSQPASFPKGLGFETISIGVIDGFGNLTVKPTTARTVVLSFAQSPSGSGALSGTLSKSTSICPASPAVCVLTFTGINILNPVIESVYQIKALASSWSLLSDVFSVQEGNGLDLLHAVELTDQGLTGVKGSSGTVVYANTRTSLNTADYDGTVLYFFEVVAQNPTAVASVISILNSSSTALANLTVPANTAIPTRIRVAFTPTTGNNNYRVRLSKNSLGTYRVHSARMIVQQTNAYRTKIYIPLLADSMGAFGTSANGTAVDTVMGTAYSQGNPIKYASWRKVAADYTGVVTGVGGSVLEVLVSSGTTGSSTRAALFDRETGLPVTATETAAYSGTTSPGVIQTASFSFDSMLDGNQFEVRLKSSSSTGIARIFKAGLWLKLNWGPGLKRVALTHRVARQFAFMSTDWSRELSGRILPGSESTSLSMNYFQCIGEPPTSPARGTVRLVSLNPGEDSVSGGTVIPFSELSLGSGELVGEFRSADFNLGGSTEWVVESALDSLPTSGRITQCGLIQLFERNGG